MKTILITGASGFIGSFLVEKALDKGFDVYAGIRSSSSRQYLTDKRIHFTELDFSDAAILTGQLFEIKQSGVNFDYIIHNAGITKANKIKQYFEVNALYTGTFIKSLAAAGQQPVKFIYISSLAAWGPGRNETQPIRETDVPNPVTSYGRSKLQAEEYIRQQTFFPYMIIRPTAVYGPKEKDIFIYFKLINKHFEPYIGKQPQKISMIYVKDLVAAIFLSVESSLINRAWFVSDGRSYSMQNIGALIRKELGKSTLKFSLPIPLIRIIAWILEKCCSMFGYMPALNLEKLNELESKNWVCEHESLENELGFSPGYTLENGIKEAAEWYRKEGWLK
ncbi:MAG: NAD(P)-dependent oxidoreductase [Bacteroidia bacterium]|nr:NAD(P)-dependent oxidoreductase [Bacteroidia bacterium]